MILQRPIIIGHFVEEDVSVERVLLLLVCLALFNFLSNPIFHLHVLALLLNQLVEFDRLVKLILCISLGWLK